MKKIISLSLVLGLSSLLMAEVVVPPKKELGIVSIPSDKANVPLDKKAMQEKILLKAGKPSPFNKNENFPNEYFLIPKNLPFALDLVLDHPKSSTLKLTEKQMKTLVKMKEEKTPEIVKSAKRIKNLELKILELLEEDEGNQTSVSHEIAMIVNEIADKKADLTVEHLQCILDVQNILTKEQREKVTAYANSTK